ncbi:MAG: polysaccharide biosynthesis tyrosine autokinase [Anaerolineae bacterium]|nr:polysaccharide biosynthesis tyrosine autokinase [Anaerolineae bacterium]
METSRYLKILLGRRWIVLLTTIVAGVVVAFFALRTVPVYTATAKLRVVPFGVNTPDYGAYLYFDRLVATYAELVQSNTVTDEAKTRLGLEWLPPYTIETIPQTELMRLDVTSEYPEMSANVANTLAQILIEQNEAIATRSSENDSSLQSRINELSDQINVLTEERTILENQIPQDVVRIAEINQELDTLRQTYNLLLLSSVQREVSQSSQANALTLVERATVPQLPSSSNSRTTIILGTIVGFLGGVGLAFIAEAINPRLYTTQQIEATTRATIIGRIPPIRRKYRKDVFGGDARAAEAFRRLRTNLINLANLNGSTGDSGPHQGKLILLASAIPGDGKSTIAANLARSLARNQQSVVLVDADMRRPTQHTIFGISNDGDSLSNVLLEKSSIDEATEGVGMQNLKLVPAGVSTFNSTELLASQKMAALTNHLLEHFDVVIFDGPAILAAPDSVALAALVDGVILVVDPKRTSQKIVDMAREELDQVGANVLGVVLNRVPADKATMWPSYSIMKQPHN